MCNIRTPRHNSCLPEGCLLAWEELLTHLTACSLSSKQSCLALNALDYRCIVQAEFGVNGVYQHVIIHCGVSSHGFRISISWLIIEGRLLDCSKLQASLQAWAKHFKHEQENAKNNAVSALCGQGWKWVRSRRMAACLSLRHALPSAVLLSPYQWSTWTDARDVLYDRCQFVTKSY